MGSWKYGAEQYTHSPPTSTSGSAQLDRRARPVRSRAGRFGTSRQFLGAIENGTRVPRPGLADALVRVLELDPVTARGLFEVVAEAFPDEVTNEQAAWWLGRSFEGTDDKERLPGGVW
jgi:hypothetical protein